jgi:hypothetical protein
MVTDQVADDQASPPAAEQPEPDATEVESMMADLEERARRFIGQRPVIAVLAAAGAGYLVARLLSRGIKWTR